MALNWDFLGCLKEDDQLTKRQYMHATSTTTTTDTATTTTTCILTTTKAKGIKVKISGDIERGVELN